MASRLQPRQPDWLASAPGEFESVARVLDFPATVGQRATARPELNVRPAAALTPVHRSGPSFETLSSSTLSPEPAYKAALGRLAQGESSVGAEACRQIGQAWLPVNRAPGSTSSASKTATLQTASHSAQTEVPAAALSAQEPPQPQAQQQVEQQQPAAKKAPHGPDPALQQQLKERIEKAKAEIKRQLSPLFGVSQALLLSSQDPQQAAQALEGMAAAGLKSGLERSLGNAVLLKSVRAQLAAGAEAAGTQGSGSSGQGHSEGLRRANSAGATLVAAVRDNPLFEQTAGRESQEEMLPGDPASDDVDSLVLRARAAVSKAQTAIAELASPPRSLHLSPPATSSSPAQDGDGAAGSSAAEPSAWGLQQGSAAEPHPPSHPPLQPPQQVQQPPPFYQVQLMPPAQQQHSLPTAQVQQQQEQQQQEHQQQEHQQLASPPVDQAQQPQQPPLAQQPYHPPPPPQQHQNWHQQQHTQGGPLVGVAPLLPPLPLSLPQEPAAPDLEGRIAQLRSRSELVVRHECERIIAAMHAMYDDFLHSVHSEGLLVRVSMGGLCSGGDGSGGQSSPNEPRVGMVPVPTAAMPSRNLAQQLQQQHPRQQQQQWRVRLQQAAEAQEGGVQGVSSPTAGEGGSCSECGDAQLAGECSENIAPNSAAGSPAIEFALEIKGLPSPKSSPGAGGVQPIGSGGQLQAAEGLGFSFGSPIRISGSQRPSPAKGASPARQLGSRPATTATVRALLPSPATPTFLSAAGAGLGGGRPAAEQARQGAYPQTSLLQGGSYLTARSNLGTGGGAAAPPGLQSTARFLQPAAAGASGGRAALPALSAGQGLARPQLGSGLAAVPAHTGQRKDLDSIVSSIRRLAAETRLKQGALASTRVMQPAAAAATPSPAATLAGAGLRATLQQPLSAAQTPASAYKTPLSHLGPREGGNTSGSGGSRFTSLRR